MSREISDINVHDELVKYDEENNTQYASLLCKRCEIVCGETNSVSIDTYKDFDHDDIIIHLHCKTCEWFDDVFVVD